MGREGEIEGKVKNRNEGKGESNGSASMCVFLNFPLNSLGLC